MAMEQSLSKRNFEKFYAKHIDKVYRFVFFRVGGNTELAEDLVSEIFIKALEHFGAYDPLKSKSSWILTITKNHLANYWRDNKKNVPLPEDTMDESDFGDDSGFWLRNALESWNKAQNKARVYELLAELEPTEAEIVTFHYLFGYSYAEIAATKSVSEGAIKVAAHRAVKKLRELF